MKRLIALSALILLALPLWGRDLVVYSVTGAAWKRTDTGWEELHRSDRLSPQDWIRTGEDACLNLLDQSTNFLIPVQSPEAIQISLLQKESKKRGVSIVKEYINFMILALKGNVQEEQQAAGVVYRGENDDKILLSPAQVLIELISSDNKKTINGVVEEGSMYYFRVTNLCAEPLFINVVDIDEAGIVSECIPVKDLARMGELLIPGKATVSLSSFPLYFVPAGTEDLLIPIASSQPFLLGQVIKDASTQALSSLHDPGRYSLRIKIVNP